MATVSPLHRQFSLFGNTDSRDTSLDPRSDQRLPLGTVPEVSGINKALRADLYVPGADGASPA